MPRPLTLLLTVLLSFAPTLISDEHAQASAPVVNLTAPPMGWNS